MSTEQFGPAPYFTLHRDWLLQGPGDVPIAHHVRLAWQVGALHYPSLELDGPNIFAVLRPETPQGNPSELTARIVLGPFAQIRIADGHAYGNETHLAHFVESRGEWCQSVGSACWPTVEFRSDEGS